MKSGRTGTFGREGFLFLFCAMLLSGGAEAHIFGTQGAGLAEGAMHPFAGLDHLLAMIAVGVWAVQQGGRALWAVPLAFIAMMAVGGAFGLMGGAVPAVETGIAGSLVVLGLLIGLAVRPSPWVAAALVGFFALFHGHAHGSELPEAAQPILYALGFITATAVLHGVGMLAGVAIGAQPWRAALRWAGAGVTAAGLMLILGM